MNRIDTLKNFIKENPKDPFYLFALAKEYAKLNEVQLAIQTFDILVQEFPEYTGTYYHFGQLLWEENQIEKSQDIMEKGLVACKQANDRHALGELQMLYDSYF